MAFAANSMYWLHPSGAGPVNPNTYGPRTPNLVGVAGVNPNTYGPRQPNLVGVGAAPAPAKKPLPRKTSPLSPMDKLIQTLYGQIETPAQQEARVNRELNTQQAAQQKLIDNEYERQRQDAMMQFQAQAAAGQAAAAMSKDLFGQVGGEFNAAAGEMKGLSHGLSKNAEGATMADVKAANAGLAATGNTPVQVGGGMFAVGGGLQQGVEDYRGGTLPAQMFGTQGEAANFGLAGMLSSQNLKATSDANAALATSMHDIRNNQAKAIDALAAGRADLAHTYLNDAKDAQIKSISLIQGLLAQKQASATATAKLKLDANKTATKNALDVAKLKLSLANFNRLTSGQNFQQKMASIKENRMAGTAGFNQTLATKKLEMDAAKLAVANGQVDVNRSKATGILYDKAGNKMLGSDGKPISSKGLLTGTAAKTMTPGQRATAMTKAQTRIPEWFYGTKSSTGKPGGKPVSADQAAGFDPTDVSTWGTNRVGYGEALKRLNRMGVRRPQALSMLSEMWHRGQGGRPWLSTEERTLARKALGPHALDRLLLQVNAMLKADPTEAGYTKAAAPVQDLLRKLGLPAAV